LAFGLRDSISARWPASGALVLLARGSICRYRTENERHEAGVLGYPDDLVRKIYRGWDRCGLPSKAGESQTSLGGLSIESAEGPTPPIGWAQSAKVPPGWKDPDHRPGFGFKVAAGVSLVIGSLLSVFGNWVISQHADDPGALARTGQGDGLLGIAAFLLFVSVALPAIGTPGGSYRRGSLLPRCPRTVLGRSLVGPTERRLRRGAAGGLGSRRAVPAALSR
jgi:hypothetical protein